MTARYYTKYVNKVSDLLLKLKYFPLFGCTHSNIQKSS